MAFVGKPSEVLIQSPSAKKALYAIPEPSIKYKFAM
jgi:hypothetical protein